MNSSQLAVSSIGRTLPRLRRGQGFKSRTTQNFIRLSFRNCKNYVYSCADLCFFLKKVIPVDYARGVPTKYSLDTLSFYGVKYIRRWPEFLLATVLFAFSFNIKEVLTSGSQYWVHAYPIKLVAAGGAWDYVDWCLGIRVVMSRHCIIEHWPEAFVWVLMRLYNDVHTILEKQGFEARRSENSN